MAIKINSRVFKSTDELYISADNRSSYGVEVKVPGINTYTFYALPEYELHICFASQPFSQTLELIDDWVYAWRGQSYILVYKVDNFDGLIELESGPFRVPGSIWAHRSPAVREKIYEGGSHYLEEEEFGGHIVAPHYYAEYGTDVSQSSFHACLNTAHDYTFTLFNTNTVLARYSNGVLTDVHDKMMIPPLCWTDTGTHPGHIGNYCAHLVNIKAWNYD